MPRTPEGFTKKEIKQILDHLGVYYVMPVQMGFGKRMLDFIICSTDGRFISCEAKRAGGKAKAFQNKIIREIKDKGGIAFVFDSKTDFLTQLPRAVIG